MWICSYNRKKRQDYCRILAVVTALLQPEVNKELDEKTSDGTYIAEAKKSPMSPAVKYAMKSGIPALTKARFEYS